MDNQFIHLPSISEVIIFEPENFLPFSDGCFEINPIIDIQNGIAIVEPYRDLEIKVLHPQVYTWLYSIYNSRAPIFENKNLVGFENLTTKASIHHIIHASCCKNPFIRNTIIDRVFNKVKYLKIENAIDRFGSDFFPNLIIVNDQNSIHKDQDEKITLLYKEWKALADSKNTRLTFDHFKIDKIKKGYFWWNHENDFAMFTWSLYLNGKIVSDLNNRNNFPNYRNKDSKDHIQKIKEMYHSFKFYNKNLFSHYESLYKEFFENIVYLNNPLEQ